MHLQLNTAWKRHENKIWKLVGEELEGFFFCFFFVFFFFLNAVYPLGSDWGCITNQQKGGE